MLLRKRPHVEVLEERNNNLPIPEPRGRNKRQAPAFLSASTQSSKKKRKTQASVEERENTFEDAFNDAIAAGTTFLLKAYPEKYTGAKNSTRYYQYFEKAVPELVRDDPEKATEIRKAMKEISAIERSKEEKKHTLNPQMIVAFIKKAPDFKIKNIIKIIKSPGAYEALAIIAYQYETFKKIITTDTDEMLARSASHRNPAKKLFFLFKMNEDNTLNHLIEIGFSIENIISLLSHEGGINNLQAVIKICFTIDKGETQFARLKALGFFAQNITNIGSHNGGRNNLEALIKICFTIEQGQTQFERLQALEFTVQYITDIASHNGGSNNLEALIKICFTIEEGQTQTQFAQLQALKFNAKDIRDILSHDGGSKNLQEFIKVCLIIEQGQTQLQRLETLGFIAKNMKDIVAHGGGSKNLQELIKICLTIEPGQTQTQFARLKALGFSAQDITDMASHNGGSKNLQALIEFCFTIEQGQRETQFKRFQALGFTAEHITRIISHGGGSKNLQELILISLTIEQGQTQNQLKRLLALGFTADDITDIASRNGGSKNLQELIKICFTIEKGQTQTQFARLHALGFTAQYIARIMSHANNCGSKNLQELIRFCLQEENADTQFNQLKNFRFTKNVMNQIWPNLTSDQCTRFAKFRFTAEKITHILSQYAGSKKLQQLIKMTKETVQITASRQLIGELKVLFPLDFLDLGPEVVPTENPDFWSKEKELAFLQQVSTVFDKEPSDETLPAQNSQSSASSTQAPILSLYPGVVANPQLVQEIRAPLVTIGIS